MYLMGRKCLTGLPSQWGSQSRVGLYRKAEANTLVYTLINYRAKLDSSNLQHQHFGFKCI
jgi:hypothetical protein